MRREFTKNEYNPSKKFKGFELKQDKLCKSILLQCLDDNQLEIVDKKEMLARRNVFKEKNVFEMKGTRTIENHIAEIETIVRQLATTDYVITDEDNICNLLLSL